MTSFWERREEQARGSQPGFLEGLLTPQKEESRVRVVRRLPLKVAWSNFLCSGWGGRGAWEDTLVKTPAGAEGLAWLLSAVSGWLLFFFIRLFILCFAIAD